MKPRLTSGVALSLAALGQIVVAGCAPLAREGADKSTVTAVTQTSAATVPVPGAPDRCTALTGRGFGDATVSAAVYVNLGEPIKPFNMPSRSTFCQVSITVEPVSGSSIKMELWLPTTWNGKFVAMGGGGFDGGIQVSAITLNNPAAEGYAGIATNAGHDQTGHADWAPGHPERIVDWAQRANHLASVVGKAVAADYFSSPVTSTYFQGCSNGGRDALMMAQRYPDDYDAIVVGAPANRFTVVMAAFASYSQTVAGVPELTAKLPAIREQVLARCDETDGVKDGVISNPTQCRFDPAEMECNSAPETGCLTAEEVKAVRTLYRGVQTPNGDVVLPGLTPGSEYEWAGWVTSPTALSASMAADFYRDLVYENKNWSLSSFTAPRDMEAAESRLGALIDADETDVTPFLKKGGKLLFYQGWDDAAIPAGGTIDYFEHASAKAGSLAQSSMRLFMLPSVAHCAGGKGPDSVDYLKAIDSWHSTGVAPERLIASKMDNPIAVYTGQPANVVRTRPLCAWPRTPEYKGAGSTDEEQNFECR